MICVLALLLANNSPKIQSMSLPGGHVLTVVHSGSPRPGAKVWSCKGPVFSETNALGVLNKGEHNPHSSISTGGAGFTDPAGKDSGHTIHQGVNLKFFEGEKVSITLQADKMSVGFRAYNCADGKANFGGGVSNGSTTVNFTFQPKEGLDKVSMVANSRSHAALYTSWTWIVGWTFTPGDQAPETPTNLTVADAQAVHASFLMRGSPVAQLSKIAYYVQRADAPTGGAADGDSLLVVRAAADKAGTATLSLTGAGGALYPLEGEVPIKSAGSKSLSLKTRTDSKGKFWYLALYRPPSYFPPPKNGETQKTVPIYFSLSDNAGGKGKLELDLVHPPIVLVHGTYDNPLFCYQTHSAEDDSAFTMEEWFERLGYRVFNVDWEEWNGMKDPSDFQTNKTRVWDGKNGIRDALDALRKDGIVVSQADVICHSQGGVIARTYCRGYPFEVSLPPTSKHYTNPDHCKAGGVDCWYHRADNYYLGDIHRLITISTTHRGSAVCSLFEALKGFPDQSMSESFIKTVLINSFLTVVDNTASGIYSGGFKNQVPDSLELQLIGPTPVPAHAIACVCTDEDMKTVRPDSVTLAYKGSVPGQGAYWNNMWKIWMGTADAVRDWALEELTKKAEAKEDPNNRTARKRLEAYRACVAALPTNSTLVNLIGQQLPESSMSRKLDALFYAIRDVVFEGDRNDCTVAMTSSFGGLKPPYTFLAEHVLHGWAPRYKNVQRDVLQAVECNGNIIDPDGFPGYSGIKSQASSFATTIRPDDSGNGKGSGNQGANTGAGNPPVNVQYLKLANLTVESAGIDMTKWTVDKAAGQAVMVQPWATVKYKITAPVAITKEGVELIFEIEATPVPGQRVSVGMTFRGDEVKREAGDRDLSVYVESTPTTAVTKKGRLVFKVSVPDYKSSNTIWVTTTDGPTFVYKYAMTTGDPRGGAGNRGTTTQPAGPAPTKPATGAGWAGSWDTERSWGVEPLILKQNGNQITGSWSGGQATLTGTVEGKVLTFTYNDTRLREKGKGKLTISEDGKEFSGVFTVDNDPDKTPISIHATRTG